MALDEGQHSSPPSPPPASTSAARTSSAWPLPAAAETCVWHLTIDPGASSPEHTLDREEVFVALRGTARAAIDGRVTDVHTGDALIVPPAVPFTSANPRPEALLGRRCLPVGGNATVAGESMTPPRAV